MTASQNKVRAALDAIAEWQGVHASAEEKEENLSPKLSFLAPQMGHILLRETRTRIVRNVPRLRSQSEAKVYSKQETRYWGSLFVQWLLKRR